MAEHPTSGRRTRPTVVRREPRRSAPLRVTIVLWLLLFALVGCGYTAPKPIPNPSGKEYCASVRLVDKQPSVTAVLLDGIGSEEKESGQVYPIPPAGSPPLSLPVIKNYCPADPSGHERGWPKGINLGLRRWAEFKVPGGTTGGSSSAPEATAACESTGGIATDDCLVARLADAGAVLLPYSYTGALLKSDTAGNAYFDFTGYSASDTQQPPTASEGNLINEVSSIHSVWPNTHIIVVGHSYGGLVAELAWQCMWGAEDTFNFPDSSYDPYIDCPGDRNHEGVVRVFSLDSPINGLPQGMCQGAALNFSSRRLRLWGVVYAVGPSDAARPDDKQRGQRWLLHGSGHTRRRYIL